MFLGHERSARRKVLGEVGRLGAVVVRHGCGQDNSIEIPLAAIHPYGRTGKGRYSSGDF